MRLFVLGNHTGTSWLGGHRLHPGKIDFAKEVKPRGPWSCCFWSRVHLERR